MILQVVVFLGDQQGVVVPCLLLATVLAYRMTEKEEVEGVVEKEEVEVGVETTDPGPVSGVTGRVGERPPCVPCF